MSNPQGGSTASNNQSLSKPAGGTLGAAAGSGVGSDQAGSVIGTGFTPIRSLFRPIMSCSQLDKLDTEQHRQLSPVPSASDLQALADMPTQLPPSSSYRGLFRPVKSCTRLDQLDCQPHSVPAAPSNDQNSSGLWFGIKSYMAKSNVTARDLNAMAPTSS